MSVARGLRWLHLGHRWLGIALGGMVLLWFVSGLVMLFVPRPQLTEAERLAASPAFSLAQVGVPPQAAWQSLKLSGAPDIVRLNHDGQRPVYRFLANGRWYRVDARDGQLLPPVSAAEARHLARAFRGEAAPEIAGVDDVDRDQWTVYRSFDAGRPFHRVRFVDGRELYIGQQSGLALLDTERWERGWNWLGSVLHWLYFTPLRALPDLWRDLVLSLSFVALLLSASGCWLGLQRLRLRRRYADGRVTPYRAGWKRWHHLAGIAGGGFVVTWLLSGWLSLAPFGLLKGSAPTPAEHRLLAGGVLDASVLGTFSLPGEMRTMREIEWRRFAGQPYLLLMTEHGRQLYRLENGIAKAQQPDLGEIAQAAVSLRPQYAIRSLQWLAEHDADYDALSHQPPPLPMVRVVFADPATSVFYIDPWRLKIERLVDDPGRWHRWLFDALHRFNLPLFGQHNRWREVVVSILSLLGTVLVLAGCMLAWHRLRHAK